MGILDEAIREHLELKRSHGADDSEIKELEDDAFGPPQRPGADDAPDPAAEAATEFMSQPDLGQAEEPQADDGPSAADLDERPPPRREGGVGIADLQEAPLRAEEPDGDEEDDDSSAEEPQPAGEHEAIRGPVGPTTEERRAIADQPTEMFDVEEEFASSEAPAPADEDLVAEEIAEPRLTAAPEPLPEPEEDEEDDFFDEQRLSDELDQALEAPLAVEEEDSGEHKVVEAVEEPPAPKAKPSGEHDALEETPDFLEEAPEDDELWFEQKPPKDFDFDD